jgi:tRNA modification GTPase
MTDTIAALSSVPAPAARIIVRLSGPASHAIAAQLSNLQSFAQASAQAAILRFRDLQCPGWIYTFRCPHSYTGEDTIEFHIPGSPVLAKLLLDDLYRRGARPAEPGEFTARAFFNGKLGLTEAEGVAATISAGNQAELNAARQLLAGEVSRQLRPITDSLAQTLALIEVAIDFSEEDVTFLASEEVSARITEADTALEALIAQSGRFEQLTHEPRIVFAGRPNAGKSSLINALTGKQRSIVSNIAGTTRDVLSAPLDLPRGRVLLADVAGIDGAGDADAHALLKSTSDADRPGSSGYLSPRLGENLSTPVSPMQAIDARMQEQAIHAIESADHLVLVVDGTDARPLLELSRMPSLHAVTKIDLPNRAADVHPQLSDVATIRLSSKTGIGLERLREALDSLAFGPERTGATLALNRRHLSAIASAREALGRAAQRVNENAPELVAMDLRDVLDALGSIVGEVSRDDVLGRIFSAFCIGK